MRRLIVAWCMLIKFSWLLHIRVMARKEWNIHLYLPPPSNSDIKLHLLGRIYLKTYKHLLLTSLIYNMSMSLTNYYLVNSIKNPPSLIYKKEQHDKMLELQKIQWIKKIMVVLFPLFTIAKYQRSRIVLVSLKKQISCRQSHPFLLQVLY